MAAGQRKEALHVVFYNINGIQQNGQEVVELMPRNTHVMAVQETRLGSEIPAGRVAGRRWHVKYTDWRFLDNPREGRGGGGTGFLIRPAILATPVHQGRSRLGVTGPEWNTVQVQVTHGVLYIVSAYFPPQTTLQQCTSAVARLQTLIEALSQEESCVGILVGGDFNAFPLKAKEANILRMMGEGSRMKITKGKRILNGLMGTGRHPPCLLNDKIRIPAGASSAEVAEAIHSYSEGRYRSVLDFALYFGDEAAVVLLIRDVFNICVYE